MPRDDQVAVDLTITPDPIQTDAEDVDPFRLSDLKPGAKFLTFMEVIKREKQAAKDRAALARSATRGH